MVDDLRPELGTYGKRRVHSPNIDSLAAGGVRFDRALATVPTCGASRASMLTGMRPTPSRFVRYYARVDEQAPDATTLPEHFKNYGYHTASLGKIFHHHDDSEESWSEAPWHPNHDEATASETWRNYALPENTRAQQASDTQGPPFESAEVRDEAYYDGKIARRAVRRLKERASQSDPFFLAVGFLKPHLPFNAPQKYWDLYDREEIEMPQFQSLPRNAPEAARHSWGELRSYGGIPESGPVSDAKARKLKHGYLASVSYTDAQVGKLLNALKEEGLKEETIVVLFGDHGWSLREHGLWCKHSTFQRALRTALIVRVPGMTDGGSTDGLVSLLDIYPTLTDLARLPDPEAGMQLQGRSFEPLLRNPNQEAGKEAVFSRYIKADAVRTDRYLYTEWRNEDGQQTARMLYDHQNDPRETVNISEEHPTLSDSLHALLPTYDLYPIGQASNSSSPTGEKQRFINENGGFEQAEAGRTRGLLNWRLSNGNTSSTFEVVKDPDDGDNLVLKVTLGSAEDAGTFAVRARHAVELSAGESYTASVRIRAENPGEGAVGLVLAPNQTEDDRNNPSNYQAEIGGGSFQTIELQNSFSPERNGTQEFVIPLSRIPPNQDGQVFYIDDLRVERVE